MLQAEAVVHLSRGHVVDGHQGKVREVAPGSCVRVQGRLCQQVLRLGLQDGNKEAAEVQILFPQAGAMGAIAGLSNS